MEETFNNLLTEEIELQSSYVFGIDLESEANVYAPKMKRTQLSCLLLFEIIDLVWRRKWQWIQWLIGKNSNNLSIKEIDLESSYGSDIDLKDSGYYKEGGGAKNIALNMILKKKPNRVIIAHLSINLIRNKFEMLKELMGNKTDMLATEISLISWTKMIYSLWVSLFKKCLIHHTGLMEHSMMDA